MTGAAQMLTVRVPLAVRKQLGGRKLVLMPGGMALRGASPADTTLVNALARAFRWRRMMETGCFGTINELAAAEKINSSYVSRLLRLTLLAPDIVEAILDGRQAEGVTLPALMETFPVPWDGQRTHIRALTHPTRNPGIGPFRSTIERPNGTRMPGTKSPAFHPDQTPPTNTLLQGGDVRPAIAVSIPRRSSA
ncbi:hypothetical protein [Falsiroseomonas sp. E2-1-a4]|uniref:hypothetical protein n=1 Tax=Falsiroseomonas sp. E2-1-a4 TaxID=3239299 RepID=UPI003F33A5D6